MLMRLIRKYPFLSYAACSIVLLMLVRLLERLGGGYDDGGLGGLGFLLSMLWEILAFPFHLPSELLFSLNGGRAVAGHTLIGLVIGALLCVLAELGLHRWRRSRGAS
jgi:hypothetical protein